MLQIVDVVPIYLDIVKVDNNDKRYNFSSYFLLHFLCKNINKNAATLSFFSLFSFNFSIFFFKFFCLYIFGSAKQQSIIKDFTYTYLTLQAPNILVFWKLLWSIAWVKMWMFPSGENCGNGSVATEQLLKITLFLFHLNNIKKAMRNEKRETETRNRNKKLFLLSQT